ncbi:cellulose binding domain-containing protein [Streptomyces sp. M19]
MDGEEHRHHHPEQLDRRLGLPSGTAVTSGWDADISQSPAGHWTARNKSYNGTLAPGASVTFGFNGTGGGSPTGCTLNGAACDGGSIPGDTPPTAPGTPTASDITTTSVKLSWTAATDDKGVRNYDVLRDGTTVATVTGTSYTDTGLSPGTDYSYTVRAGTPPARPARPAAPRREDHRQRRRDNPAPRSSSATSPSGASTTAATT